MRRVALIFSILQWCLFVTLVCAGLTSFLILCGEDTPGQPMGNRVFIGWKLAAGAAFCICIMTGKYLNRRGLLPEFNGTDNDAVWEEKI